METKKCFAGADELTPSVPQYFSWINNTNEGSTEGQTLANLDFFRFMREKYGMRIELYAWDAGNYDGASSGFGDVNSDKFRAQYPEGYARVVEAAGKIGVRMGLWGSPDGFGDDAETEKRRYDFFLHLCRDYHFALFKYDSVCGELRREKAGVFRKMLMECRKHVPDLIVLNHRLELYEAKDCATTFLLGGQEAYTDVNIRNNITGMHHRSYLFSRDHSPELTRLTEDHGVCLSSSLDYFEDELIYQAFNRSLILAPEIYGNPWFLRDEELPRLARIFNLHRRVRDILVHGQLLPESYGPNACVRGNGTHRFLTTGNDTWEDKTLMLRLSEEIGLEACGKVRVALRFPYEKDLGEFRFGEEVEIRLQPFRACLIEIAAGNALLPVLTGCEYRMIREDEDGCPVEVEYIRSNGGKISLLKDGEEKPFAEVSPVDRAEKSPVLLGTLDQYIPPREDAELLFETAMIAIDNDSLECQCMKRSGPSAIPEVNRCREYFFEQETYLIRGCESGAMFDGNPETFFDGQSRLYDKPIRICGGCLRVDAGEVLDADRVEIECFATLEPTEEFLPQNIPTLLEYSEDLSLFTPSALAETTVVNKTEITRSLVRKKHTVYANHGKRIRITYMVSGPFRYLRLPEPMDRIYSVRFFRGEHEIIPASPHANNLQPAYFRMKTAEHVIGTLMLPEGAEGKRIAVAVNGKTGIENISFCIRVDGKLYGCPDRAPSFLVNNWESNVKSVEANHTFFFALPDAIMDRHLEVIGSLHSTHKNTDVRVYLCDVHA